MSATQRLVTGTPHPLATTGTHAPWSPRVAQVRDQPHRPAPPSTLTYPCPPSPTPPPYYCAIPAREQPPRSTPPHLAHLTPPPVARIHEHAHVRRPLRLRVHACLLPRPPLSSPTSLGSFTGRKSQVCEPGLAWTVTKLSTSGIRHSTVIAGQPGASTVASTPLSYECVRIEQLTHMQAQ
ncbi:hypothetical protein HD554DRAFT_1691153 [Boletus coccyginus]|nr:hypothetical protein HD554DRAFT_1691153 [Boletus coccyginus]